MTGPRDLEELVECYGIAGSDRNQILASDNAVRALRQLCEIIRRDPALRDAPRRVGFTHDPETGEPVHTALVLSLDDYSFEETENKISEILSKAGKLLQKARIVVDIRPF